MRCVNVCVQNKSVYLVLCHNRLTGILATNNFSTTVTASSAHTPGNKSRLKAADKLLFSCWNSEKQLILCWILISGWTRLNFWNSEKRLISIWKIQTKIGSAHVFYHMCVAESVVIDTIAIVCVAFSARLVALSLFALWSFLLFLVLKSKPRTQVIWLLKSPSCAVVQLQVCTLLYWYRFPCNVCWSTFLAFSNH